MTHYLRENITKHERKKHSRTVTMQRITFFSGDKYDSDILPTFLMGMLSQIQCFI